tara:strand:- start:1076 stop:1600 length:525 start_codon:yes stop_codon:yes gene_type:complete
MTAATAATTTLPLTSLGEEPMGTLTGTTPPPSWYRWDYRVYCYEREQGEWLFSQNIRGSFAHQREYMTFDEENDLTWNGYCGWMDGGKLHFTSLEEAQDFVDMHVRTKEDINIVDSIYDIYYVSRELDEKEVSSGEYKETEIKVAHYWFNGDTGRQIHWVSEKPYTDYSKVEFS